MEELRKALRSARIGASSPRLLFEVGDERAYCLTVPGARATSTWSKLLLALPKTGHYPVLLGEPEECERVVENRLDEGETRTADLIEKALAFDGVGWLESEYRYLLEEDGAMPDDPNEALLAPAHFSGLPRGPWSKGKRGAHVFLTPLDLSTDLPHPRACIGLVPTAEHWQVPILLRFGAFNSCPHADEHAGFLRRWQEQYGAELVALTPDVMEVRATRPPKKRPEALQLAREHYLYCRDIVDQGGQTIDNLAAERLNGSAWFFWWD